MEPERRRNTRVILDGDGSNAVLRGAVPVSVRDISPGGLRLGLGSSLEPGGVYPLTALLRGLYVTTLVRITRCRPGPPLPPSNGRQETWEAGAEFLWRDEADASAVRSWLKKRALAAS